MASHTATAGYAPQFSNPFQSVAGAQQSVYPTSSSDSFLSIDPLTKLPLPHAAQQSSLPHGSQQSPAQVPHHHHHILTSASAPLPTTSTAAAMSLSYQPAPVYAADQLRMNALAASAPAASYPETAFSSMPPPSALYSHAAVTTGPMYDNTAAAYTTTAGYLPSNALQQMADRRLSHPVSVASDFFGSRIDDRQRGTSLNNNAGPGFGSNFLDALEASKGLMDMGNDLTDATPRAEPRRTDGYFPGPHSNHSSISSASNYGSYFGSMDSNASGYSSNTDIETLSHPQRLPGVSGLLGSTLGSSLSSNMPPAPQSMMTQFSSKVSTGTPKKHKCKICEKRFTRPSSLQTHIYSHTGEKPFQCLVDGCGRHFSVVSNLRRHAKVHRNGDHESESYTDTDHGSPRSTVSTQESVGSINEE